MGALAQGGKGPVFTFGAVGIGALSVAMFVHPLGHLLTLFGILCLMVAAFLANFYRDPDRPIPNQSGVVACPADGHVMFVVRERAIGRRPSQEELGSKELVSDSLTGEWFPQPCELPLDFTTEQRWEEVPLGQESATDVWRIAIFMSPLDVHVNRSPVAGKILRMEHRTGKGRRRGPFKPAYAKESQYNERVRTVIESSEDEAKLEVVQISGALARTIIPWKGIGDSLRRGERYGMIRLGSRVDTRVSAARFTPTVTGVIPQANLDTKSSSSAKSAPKKGEFVRAGSTTIFRTNIPVEEE